MNWKGKRVLVTGGTGFVGSHLVERLVQEQAQVVSTFQTLDHRSYFSQRQLDHKSALSHTDITNFEALYHVVTKFDVDYIFHLAAQAIVEVAYHNPRQTLASNIMGTVNVLESARLFPHIKGVIVASSDKAYGKTNHPKYVETDPLVGDHPYEVSKSASDLITRSYVSTYQLPAIITRFGNIYGEGDLNFSRIIPGMLQCLLSKTPLELRSDGSFVRDYLYVKDVVNGYLLAAESIDDNKGEAFNFGSNETLSVLELIELTNKVLNEKIDFKILNTAKNEIPYQSLDFSKATEKLGWSPKHTLTQSLPSLISYYKQVL